MTTIFEALREDHQTQRLLANALIETQGDSRSRTQLFRDLCAELQAHASAEERYLYAPLLEFDLTQGKSRHGIAEHHKIDKSIARLKSIDHSSSAWLTEARALRDLIFHHLEEEEQEVFQQAGRVLSGQQKTMLADEYDQLMGAERSRLLATEQV